MIYILCNFPGTVEALFLLNVGKKKNAYGTCLFLSRI